MIISRRDIAKAQEVFRIYYAGMSVEERQVLELYIEAGRTREPFHTGLEVRPPERSCTPFSMTARMTALGDTLVAVLAVAVGLPLFGSTGYSRARLA